MGPNEVDPCGLKEVGRLSREVGSGREANRAAAAREVMKVGDGERWMVADGGSERRRRMIAKVVADDGDSGRRFGGLWQQEGHGEGSAAEAGMAVVVDCG